MAGARAIDDADIFLIVDGDVGASAVEARRLLLPVLADEADMTIANLPPGVTGGFGTVKKTAQWGVRRATGLELKAPISGQRAMRADLLRSMKPSGHFGFSVSLSIDGSRAGARIVEVDVPLTHRHTGKTLSGFVHRGKQGFFLLRALWPRLTSTRFRIVGAFLTMAVLGALLLFSGAQQAKVAGVVQPPARKVVIFGMPGLTWDELRTQTPNLEALADDGAVADLMVKTASTSPSTHEAYASLGTGNPVKASLLAALALPADADFESDTAANALDPPHGRAPAGRHRRDGRGRAGAQQREQAPEHRPGRAGRRPRRCGASHRGGRQLGHRRGRRRLSPDRPATHRCGRHDRQRLGRRAARWGRSCSCRTPTSPTGAAPIRTPSWVRSSGRSRTPTWWSSTPVTSTGRTSSDGPSSPSRRPRRATRALAATDDILGRIADQIDDDTLLIVTGVRPPRGAWRLSPAVCTARASRTGTGTHRAPTGRAWRPSSTWRRPC